MQKRLWECELARFKWNELRIARGTADHVPGALTQLLNAPSPEEADEAYWQLENSVVVQGQLFESAEAVVRVLLAALAELPLRGVTGALELLFQIVHGQAHEDEPRRDMGEVCRAAAREGAWLLHGLRMNADLPVRRAVDEILEVIDAERLEWLEQQGLPRYRSEFSIDPSAAGLRGGTRRARRREDSGPLQRIRQGIAAWLHIKSSPGASSAHEAHRDTPQQSVVDRRVRNRVMEYLEFVATAESDVPLVKTADLVNEWEDWVPNMPNPEFLTPPYTADEVAALQAFAGAWETFCDATPDWPDSYRELFAHPAWPAFRDAAARALDVLMKRGALPED